MFDVRWVHIFEDDTARVEVYRPDSEDIPLSRRPRQAFELHRDGTAVVFSGGADDRAEAGSARWAETADGVVVTEEKTGARFRIVKQAPEQLIVSRH